MNDWELLEKTEQVDQKDYETVKNLPVLALLKYPVKSCRRLDFEETIKNVNAQPL